MGEGEKYGISLKGITHGYKDDAGHMRTLYNDITMDIPAGELFVILGRNGVGKSTLLKSVAGLLKPLSGRILVGRAPVDELSVRQLASKVSFVSTEIIKMVNLSARSVVAMGRSLYTNWIGALSEEDSRIVDSSLKLVGAENLAGKNMDSLSDGERQRVMIARALAQDAPVIILDEPTAFLDVPNKYAVGLLLRNLAHAHGKTVIFSTHDLDVALRLADSVCVIGEGGFRTGVPEDIVMDGVLDSMFEGTDVGFDMLRSDIKINYPLHGRIRLFAPAQYENLLAQALERTGYSLSCDEDCADRLDVSEKDGNLSLKLTMGGDIRSFNKIGELLKFLRSK